MENEYRLLHEHFDDERYDIPFNDSDHFELLESINNNDHMRERDFMDARWMPRFLVSVILKFDSDYPGFDGVWYPRVVDLLRHSLTRPFLLDHIANTIIDYRKEILSTLLTVPEFATVCFTILDEIEFESEHPDFVPQLWQKSLEIALLTIAQQGDDPEKAKMIFQIFRKINSKKFQKKSLVSRNRKSKLPAETRKEELLLSMIERFPLHPFMANQEMERSFLLPTILVPLFEDFKTFHQKSPHDNGILSFQHIKWDGYFWIMKTLTYYQYKGQIPNWQKLELDLATTFRNEYLALFKTELVERFDYSEKKKVQSMPYWREQLEQIQIFNWVYPFHLLSKRNVLSPFLSPVLEPIIATDEYDETNKLIGDKLRTHIGVLITFLKQSFQPPSTSLFEKRDLEKVRTDVENRITSYIRAFAVNEPMNARIDIFYYQRETSYDTSRNEALLPQIAQIIHTFHNRSEIVEAIAESNDLSKILTVAESVASEGVRRMLVEKVKVSELASLLVRPFHWIPEVQNTLVQLRSYPELQSQLEKVLDFWKEKIEARDSQHQKLAFETQLMIAYFKRSLDELENVKKPDLSNTPLRDDVSLDNYRDFYRALIKMETDPASSYETFNRLAGLLPQYPVMALNRMAAKVAVADRNKGDVVQYKEALEEWQHYEDTHPNAVESLNDIFYANKLRTLLKLDRFQELDEQYEKLEPRFKFLQDVLEPKVLSLIQHKRIDEASRLVDEAETYHHLGDDTALSFISDLRSKVNGVDNIQILQTHFITIFKSAPEKLVRIFPPDTNDKDTLIEFVVKEISLAASKMLDKILAIEDIVGENRYNDLLVLALDSRISLWGWTANEQIRKGSSPNGVEPGEIDFDIKDGRRNVIVTCEAFRYSSETKAEEHINKLLTKYTHNRRFQIIIIYHEGLNKHFDSKWDKYRTTIIPNLNFPPDFELDPSGVEDVSADFRLTASGVRIGKSTHKETTLFHIYINTQYYK
jgi:hypothetical protein